MHHSGTSQEAGRAGGTTADSTTEDRFSPAVWHISFVEQCNLRCRYCSTGFGQFGRSGRCMTRPVWERLSELIATSAAKGAAIQIEFGGGETFLRFDEALLFLRHLRGLSHERGAGVSAAIATNGTLPTGRQLETCVAEGIALAFSIDGPASMHDGFGFSLRGGVPRIAMETFCEYSTLLDSTGPGMRCDVTGVVAGNGRLREAARFWREQGVNRFRAIPAEPSRYLGKQDLGLWRRRRSEYLRDLEELAFAEAARLRGRAFETEYWGPWDSSVAGSTCGTARRLSPAARAFRLLASDAAGQLFPCQGFIGSVQWSIGDVARGIDSGRLAAFRAAMRDALAPCDRCWARFLCGGGCCAGDPKAGIVLNKWEGCEFSQSLAEIAIRSYLELSRNGR